MLNDPILTTEPHGEQSLRRCDTEDDQRIGNLLFELSSNNDDSAIVMTGEELTSLANQWLVYSSMPATASSAPNVVKL